MTGRVLGVCICCSVREKCIFAEIGEQELEGRARWVRYRERDTIFHEDGPAFGLYVIYQGKVMLFKRARDGYCRIFEILGPASLFGEESLLEDATYAASAQALTETKVLFIARAEIQAFLQHASVRQRFLERVLQRMRHTEELLLETCHSSAGERLARLLLRLAHEHGRPQNDRFLWIDLGLTQSELGEMVRLSREAVSKYLSVFKDQNLISLQERKLLVDPLALGQVLHPAPDSATADLHQPSFTTQPKLWAKLYKKRGETYAAKADLDHTGGCTRSSSGGADAPPGKGRYQPASDTADGAAACGGECLRQLSPRRDASVGEGFSDEQEVRGGLAL